jgi:adenine/guanine phosphoribosyltransferase-like PRPP-binding protein
MPIKSLIRTIPDYPKPGVMFRDITTLLADPAGFKLTIDELVAHGRERHVDKVACIESRGLIIGAPVAYELGTGLVPLRKKSKLPWKTVGRDYELSGVCAGGVRRTLTTGRRPSNKREAVLSTHCTPPPPRPPPPAREGAQ